MILELRLCLTPHFPNRVSLTGAHQFTDNSLNPLQEKVDTQLCKRLKFPGLWGLK